MKRQIALLLIIALSGFVACQNVDEKQTAETKSNAAKTEQVEQADQTDEKAVVSETTDEPKILENKQALQTKKIIAAESVQTGDEICGLNVTSINFVPGGMFEVEFEGEMDLQGYIYDNQHDDCMEFSIENPTTYVKIDGSEYALLEYRIPPTNPIFFR